MTLTLEIVESSATIPVEHPRHVFGEEGGTLGRAPQNSWVLTHNEVSKQHAVITHRSGVFYIQDTSRNGVSVNSIENRLARNRPYALKTGDRIYIEPYQIEVWIDASQSFAPSAPLDPFGADDPFSAGLDPLCRRVWDRHRQLRSPTTWIPSSSSSRWPVSRCESPIRSRHASMSC